jgi:aldehyde dehydrogenase (NAD+)
MDTTKKFYINGEWIDPVVPQFRDLVNPATEEICGRIAMGSAEDVNKAVDAAEAALASYSAQPISYRLDLLKRLKEKLQSRTEELTEAITKTIGAPTNFSRDVQVGGALANFEAMLNIAETYQPISKIGKTSIRKEPIGVVGLITPWNYPLNQIVFKVVPALAAGCTVVLKPSEITPLDAILFAEAVADVGFPPGVFNLVNGDGLSVGEAISRHPKIRMVSFTGSTRAGVQIAKAAADTVKRVTQELGGKSANIILDDADLKSAVTVGVQACFANSGQTCDAPTLMMVPAKLFADAKIFAEAAANAHKVGDPQAHSTDLGPVANVNQFEKIQNLIQTGIDEGAELIAGGTGRPDSLTRGYYVKPTVFAVEHQNYEIVREEIFGPVLVLIPYTDVEQAIAMANSGVYGLAGYVVSSNQDRARGVAEKLEAGMVCINYPDWDSHAPFGGYKQSGNGRESGVLGFEEYLETKSIVGYH